jgi:glycosyltransferase involved in cell wall biosynthesis
MRILHCPAGVGGNAWILSRAEREIGLNSSVMVYSGNWINYPADINLHLEKYGGIIKYIKVFAFLCRAIISYDIFHFNFGSSFLPNFKKFPFLSLSDVLILHFLHKKIIVTYQGCDARQKSYCINKFIYSACSQSDCYGGICDDRTDLLKAKRIEKFNKYADKIFTINPDLLYVLPSRTEFSPYTTVNLNEWYPVSKENNGKFVIVHSPTNRSCKGSDYIVNAVHELQKKFSDVELVLVENVPHEKVKDLYKKADLAIDQLFVGWYGGFAVEMMSLGKPVVCYIREEDLKFIPPEMKADLPVINANSSNIYSVLERLIQDKARLRDIGVKSRTYVEKWHDPIKIASKMKQVYESLFKFEQN